MSTNSTSTNNLPFKRKSRGTAERASSAKSKHKDAAAEPIPPLTALMSLREWKQRYSVGDAGMSREIQSPFWRSIALNPYDLFTEQSLLAALKASLARLFNDKLRKSRICYLLNLRLSCQYRAEQTAQLLDTYVFANEQLLKIPDDCTIVIVTMSLLPNEEAVHALQLRTPFLPIGSMARYNAAYTENHPSVAMKHGKSSAVPTRPNNINYKNYSEEELIESDLLNRFIKRGAYLYDELREREPVTLAYLIAERKMKEMQLQEQEREKKAKSRKPKKSRAAARATSSTTSTSAIVDDDDDEEGISLSSEEEEEEEIGSESEEDEADAELPFAGDSDDDSKVANANQHVATPPQNNRDGDDESSGSTDLSAHFSSDEDDAGAAAEAIEGQQADKYVDDSVAVVPPQPKKWRYAAPNPVPVMEKQKKKSFENPSQPLKIDLKRADECEWMRLVVAKNAYRFLFDISCVVPNKAMLLAHSRLIGVNIEPGVSMLPQVMKCDEEQTSMDFQTTNAARLKLSLAEVETARRLANAAALSTSKESNIDMPLDDNPRQAVARSTVDENKNEIVEPRVSVTSLLSPQFHEDSDHDILPIRDSEIDHPLNDYRRFVDASKLTLYEMNCYASQRLAVLLLAFQAYFVETSYERREPHIESLIRSQYPVHSGATYHLIHGIAGAKDRQLMHEGIGLAMLCFCAKHDETLAESLLLMEMCYIKHKQEMKAMEFNMGHNDEDGDENNDNEHEEGKTIRLKEAIEKHSQTIVNYIEECTDVLSLQNAPIVLQQQEVATYIEFFAILQDLIDDWKKALAEIEENRQYEPAAENGEENNE